MHTSQARTRIGLSIAALALSLGLISSQALAADAAPAISHGEVRKVDKSAKKITLKHGEIKNLQMPPMTMVFRVKDPAMLDQVKTGDKVEFSAEDNNGALTLTAIKPMP